MDSIPCKRDTGIFFHQNETLSSRYQSQMCQLEVDLANRSLDARSSLLVSCYLPSICTGFHCCVDVPAINMSFNAYLSVDPCNYMLTVGIENFSFNKSLDYYTFGQDGLFSLAGVLKIM
ncbi:uncharacterized protein LOC144627472 [Crassostrea virginica]